MTARPDPSGPDTPDRQPRDPGLADRHLLERDGGPLDLDEFRRNGYRMIDWIADYLAGLDQRPVREPVEPGEVAAKLPDEAPERPEPFDRIAADLDEIVVPGLTHWQHPGWFAYFQAMSSPPSVLGELASAGLGVQGMLWSTAPAATEIESRVLDWLVTAMDLPTAWKTTGAGGGVIQSSASDSTHAALVTAREQCRQRTGAPAESMVVYASDQAHSAMEKGARMVGIGHFRPIAVDEWFAARPDDLERAVAEDRRAGLTPAFVGSTLGTTGTTAVDPLRRMGEAARAEGMWHHVDAAYAGSAMICPEMRGHLDGLELVDSYTFNPHKWLATNLDCSVLWMADRRPLVEFMSIIPSFLRDKATESGNVIDYRDWQVPLGRRFRALKLWFVLRSFGLEGLRAMIRTHIAWAQSLADRIQAHPRLELIAPVPFALVCFAHTAGNQSTDALAEAINASGHSYLTTAEANNRHFIRASIGSTWTTKTHVDRLWNEISTNAERISHA